MSGSEPTSGLPSGSDVKPWWKLWERNQTWQDNLARRATHKALDIPDDEMQITSTRTGVGAAGLIGIAAAAGLPGVLGVVMFWRSVLDRPPAEPPAPPGAPGTPPAGDGAGTAPGPSPAGPGGAACRDEVWDYRVRSRVVPRPSALPADAGASSREGT